MGKFLKNLFLLIFFINKIYSQGYFQETIYYKIEQEYLKSFANLNISKQDLLTIIDQDNKIDKIKYKEIINKIKAEEKRKEILYTLFDLKEQEYAIYQEKPETNFNSSLWQDLEIYSGQHLSYNSLINKINRTQTDTGFVMLSKFIAEPIINKKELLRRQDIIKELVENKELFNNLDNIIKNYAKIEPELISFWDERFTTILFTSDNYFPPFPFNIFPENILNTVFPAELINRLNKSPNKLTLLNLYNNYITFKSLLSSSYGIMAHLKLTKENFNKFKDSNQNFNINNPFLSAGKSFLYYTKTTYHLSEIPVSIFLMYKTLKTEYKNFLILKKAYQKLKTVAFTINSLPNIKKLAETNSRLKENLDCLEKVKYLFDNSKSYNLDFDILLKQLKSKSFNYAKDYNSLIVLNKGKILSASFLMLKTQNYLSDILQVIGEIDAYLSIAKLYKEHENLNSKYAFVNFLDSDKPYFNLKNFWLPFIEPEKVILNSLEMGNNLAKNLIISGPNAGGKSTILKAIIISFLLAQTITIAPAQEVSFTPFSYLDTYLNITDDISSGKSLFKAEVLRIKNLLKTIKELDPKLFSFVIMDEIFSGTNPTEGQAAGYGVGKYLSKISNNITLIASHFEKLTNLEKDTNGLFKNYKVMVEKSSDGKLIYPFKLLEGKTNQTIAIEILKNENFDPEIIEQAYSLL